MSDVWPAVHAERLALVRDLEGIAVERFLTPSLCPVWTVHDVVAHLVDDATTTPLRFARGLLATRFDFDALNAAGVARERRDDPRATVAALAAAALRTTSAPAPRATRYVEVVVHGEDVRRPLGLVHTYPPEAVLAALRHQLRTGVSTGGGRERAAGVRLVATDADLAHGTGPEVRGTALALLLAVSSRPVAADELTGPGTPLVR
ncbi:maleylpyruvate isomerase family mycothiol-dependent enzyme [Cellulomonas endophytica]|uniref:maleylpyruvate isomerase family mycothiol-dependent enzyme n=1 Tax=Cellulomonas endophytica TaxID=2494735 RepID=UPI0010113ED1|nr:maleylpyruvate isomerase family mycothiol-dependent enzyme [Cellulomonas endophytica]